MKIEKFDDGTSMEWFSRESLLYKKGEFETQVVYDFFKISFFKEGREIMANELRKWERCPENSEIEISLNEKNEIIEKAVKYFKNRKFEVRVNGTV